MKTYTVQTVFKFLSNRAAFQLFNLSAVLKADCGPEFITLAKLTMKDEVTAEIEFNVPGYDQQDAEGRLLSLFGNHHQEYSVRVLARQVLTRGGTLIETGDELHSGLAILKGTMFRTRVACAIRAMRSATGQRGRNCRVVIRRGRPVCVPNSVDPR